MSLPGLRYEFTPAITGLAATTSDGRSCPTQQGCVGPWIRLEIQMFSSTGSSASRMRYIAGIFTATVIWAMCVPSDVVAQNGFNGPGTYEISNARSGQVLDMKQDGQNGIYLVRGANTDAQKWDVSRTDSGYYFLRNETNGAALEVVAGRNTSVQALPYTGNNSQQWTLNAGSNGRTSILSRGGSALEASPSRGRNGAAIQIRSANGNGNQQFTFRQLSGASTARWNGNRDNRDYRSNTITCSSENGRSATCNADTRGGVRLVRELSSSSCIQGSTWDYNANGIWVDHGCRAEFELTSDRRSPRSDANAGNRVTIERNNTVSWQSQGTTMARVYTQTDNGREQLFAEGRSGTQGATWITSGHLYVFILRDANGTELARDQSDLRSASNGNQRGYPDNSRSDVRRGTINAGTTIAVRTNEAIDARNGGAQPFTGTISQDVPDSNGNIAIPKGSDVELVVKSVSNNELALDLNAVTVNGQRYEIEAGDSSLGGDRKDGIGANQRTGEYVGGGALLGAIIGAIAGGGKGAAIGAGAGAAAGAGTQVLTRGKNVKVPSESLLTFQLEQPLQMRLTRR
jgi:hypothetical protein